MSNQVPSVTNPSVAPQAPGGIPQFQVPAPVNGSARMDAIQTMNANDSKLAALNNAIQGGSRRKWRGGQSAPGLTVLPPGPTPIYKDTLAGTPYSAQNQITGSMVTTLNQNEQAKYDQVSYVPPVKTGGTRRKRKGGVKWGCYSGGKRKSRRHSKKSSKKSRKSRRK
ncbi:MAG: hypothetical protein EBY20_01415 [Alphaproteobacteria bacterium]|jgi:hypothetical protein|uniref:Uncharacterized protein n=1 Tax=viral metagenome TaxID=1070528 RepID=A0A6C0HPF1_9ZZZZ|nr:hypothetical protein [Alphaproteobacteria bacterium]